MSSSFLPFSPQQREKQMLLQWCLKGIVEREPLFGDAHAVAALRSHGLSSAWLRRFQKSYLHHFPTLSHAALSQTALDAHVNGFGASKATTPYISLTAGCIELDPCNSTTQHYSALETALSFATEGGTKSGYVFRLWVLVSPKAAAELSGFGEEVRELNLFRQFATYHNEGEIAAKLFIPARQIETVEKYDHNLNLLARWQNASFVSPDRVSNVVEVL